MDDLASQVIHAGDQTALLLADGLTCAVGHGMIEGPNQQDQEAAA